MTEDKKFEADSLPPFPWQVTDNYTVRDANGDVLWHDKADIAGEVVDAMNMLAEDGWFRPLTVAQEELYNAYVRADTRIQAALTAIEKFRKDGTITLDHSPKIADLESPAELLDILHDVLSGGGSMTYFPCRYAVIPNVGEDGMCVAHATEEYAGVRYCKPHADVLKAVHP